MDKPQILDPKIHKVQTFLSDCIQLGDVLQQLLAYTGPADLTVSTFSTGEEFLRRLHKLREMKLVNYAILYCDHKAAEKTARINPMLRSVYDEMYFCANHSKVMIIEGEKEDILVMTSQNQTRGNRLENYAIISDRMALTIIKNKLRNLKTFDAYGNK